MSIQQTLENNPARYNSLNSAGTPRPGAALLQGIVHCGKCGHQMTVQYSQGGQNRCNYLYQQRFQPVCLSTRSDAIDRVVERELLAAISTSELNLLEAAIQRVNERNAILHKARTQKFQRLQYEVERSQKQYQRCDPENRLVASELERRWEDALNALRVAENEQQLLDQENGDRTLSPSLAKQWNAAGASISSHWHDERLDNTQKKRIVRALIDKVVLRHPEAGKLEIKIVWKSGMHTTQAIDLRVGSLASLAKGNELRDKIIELAKSAMPDEWIAYTLSRQGYRACYHTYVGLSTVQRIRREEGIKYDPQMRFLRDNARRFSLRQLAKKLDVKITWVFEQIILDKVAIEPDPTERRFIVEADSEAIGKLVALRNQRRQVCAQGEAS